MSGPVALKTLEAVQLVPFKCYTDARGTLVPIEAEADAPFAIRRLFYIRPKHAEETRGQHGHYRCSQLLICLAGSVRVTVQDGSRSQDFLLNRQDEGLLIPPTLWAEEVYETVDTLLLVLCDRPFEKDDYIDDLGAFRALRASS